MLATARAAATRAPRVTGDRPGQSDVDGALLFELEIAAQYSAAQRELKKCQVMHAPGDLCRRLLRPLTSWTHPRFESFALTLHPYVPSSHVQGERDAYKCEADGLRRTLLELQGGPDRCGRTAC
jgi:hypothetical protein